MTHRSGQTVQKFGKYDETKIEKRIQLIPSCNKSQEKNKNIKSKW